MASTVLFSEDHTDKASSSGSEHERWPDHFRSSRSSSPAASLGYESHHSLRAHTYQAKKDSSPEPAASTKSSSKDKETDQPKPAKPRVIYVQAQPLQAHQQGYTYYPSQYVYGGSLQPQPIMVHNGQPVQYVYAAAPAPAPAPAEKKEKEEKPKKSSSPKKEFTYVPKKSEPEEKKKKPSTNPWIGRTKAQVGEDYVKIAKQLGAYEKRKVAPTDAKDDQPFWVVENDGSHTLRYVCSVTLSEPDNDRVLTTQ